jgi:trimeric autotransporter adhesin
MKNLFLFIALLFTANASAQATIIKDINAGTSGAFEDYIYEFAGYGNAIYFVAKDATTGFELWKSDGTAAGTIRVKDINAGTLDSKPRNLVVANNKLFFTAQTAAEGRELWVTDGTDAGTKIVKNILAGTGSSIQEDTKLVVFNNQVYFEANDGTTGSELWKSDGTDAGTTIVKDINAGSSSNYARNLVVFQNKLFFFSFTEMYSTDGTAAGTVKIKTFSSTSTYIAAPYVHNSKLYLSVGLQGYYSAEPWISDGTDVGTKLLKDIIPGAADGSSPENFIGFKGLVLIDVDGIWFTTGTESGTARFLSTPMRLYQNERLTFANDGNKLYFTALSDASSFWGKDLWVLDGTTGERRVVKYINGTVLGSKPEWLTLANGKAYFTAENFDNGRELWVSDGTEFGTRLAADIVAGRDGGNPQNTIFWNGNLYFAATTAANGTELWKFAVPTATTDLIASKDLFKIAQNPVNQSIAIDWTNSENQILTLTNAVGQVVATHKTADKTGSWRFNTSELPNGLYILKGQTSAAYQVEKIVVQH